MKIKIEVFDKEMELQEAKELYLELKELFDKDHYETPPISSSNLPILFI